MSRNGESGACPPAGESIYLRPVTDDDIEFLRQLYASTRAAEKLSGGWSNEQWDDFISMQFDLQHHQFHYVYPNPTFHIVMVGNRPVGRFYVNHQSDEIHIIDISILPEYRGHGMGSLLIGRVLLDGMDNSIPVTLHVEKSNSSFRLYQRLGFKVKEDCGAFWVMVHNPTEKTVSDPAPVANLAAAGELPAMPPEALAAMLGVPLFSTDLHMPSYRVGTVGRWRLSRSGFLIDCGYHSGRWAVSDMPVLLRDARGDGTSWDTWMSLSPHEIESQELGCRHAYGYSVVMGLGMGWVAVNMALNPQVQRVTVVERDPEVVDLFHRSGVLDDIPSSCAGKIRIVLADALEWQPDEPVDFLYADIWLGLEEPQTLHEVRRMQNNVKAGQVYFWGQELAIHALAGEGAEVGITGVEAIRRCVAEKIRLPLLVPDGIDYPQMIDTVVRQRRQRFPDRRCQ